MGDPRRIIQISSCGVPCDINTQCSTFLYALCTDGTVWRSDDQHPEWERLPDIPQDIAVQKPESAPRIVVTDEIRRRFSKRFDDDNAEAMSKEQWGAWVDALPLEEFMAMMECKEPSK